MKFVTNLCLLICLVCGSFSVFSQKNSDKLKQEQDKLEKKIAVTKSLLQRNQVKSNVTLSELKVLEEQLKFREQLLQNYDYQIRSSEMKIEEKTKQLEELEQKLVELVEQYKQLLLYAYKHRSKEGQLMFLVSADTYYDALKRKKYLEKVADLQRKQKEIILQHRKLIAKEKSSLEKEIIVKKSVVEQKQVEKTNILNDKQLKQENLSKIKKEESKLTSDIKYIENKKIILKQRIKEAINAELALEETRRKAREKKAEEERRRNELAKTKTSETSNDAATTTKRTLTITETKELALNQSFETNKGRLPWPVEKGVITEGYGTHAHPKIPSLKVNNNGIDISTTKSANVRAVFEGEVTSVLSIPGAGKVVIIKHGNYRTVYSNLQESYVSVGAKVSTKQLIGSLLPQDGEALSVAHFEIHHVTNGQILRINPSIWIAK